MTTIRSPIVSVLGHVDHGKSSVLDAIRDTDILSTEAGAITQAIGASIVSKKTLEIKCGELLKNLGIQLTIPGLLFIDTPGHAAFSSLRKRGGSLADIAVVVVDINEGFKPQTIEAIEILKAAKTPFIIAANKLDLIPGFRMPADDSKPVLQVINEQESNVQSKIETRLYELVGQMYDNFQITCERFDRVQDFTQQVAVVPISAKKQTRNKKHLGIAEALMVLGALAQKFLEKNLAFEEQGPAKGTILEVKEEKGLGLTLDVIIYNGTLRVNDTVVVGGKNEPIVSRVRALFEPEENAEMRDKKSGFKAVKKVTAATGVKIGCPDIEGVTSGMPLISCEKTDEAIQEAKGFVQAQIEEVQVPLDEKGLIIKADNVGSLEALSVLLRDKGFNIRKARVGPITKKDLIDAESNYEEDPLLSCILGFNIPQEPSSEKVKVITSDVIYHIIEAYEEWEVQERKRLDALKLEGLMKPAKVEILANCIFRQSNPCVMGVEVLEGKIRTNMPLMKEGGDKLNIVKEIQLNKKNVQEAEKSTQVAISIPGITGGRHVDEGDILYTDMSPITFREFKKHSKLLTPEEKELLKEIAEIKRKEDPMWGM